jgi:hypothetical protein
MTLARTKRYVVAVLCAAGLSMLGVTAIADGGSGSGDGSVTWMTPSGPIVISEQEARNRCEQCQTQQDGNANNNACFMNVQICANFNIVIAPTIGH